MLDRRFMQRSYVFFIHALIFVSCFSQSCSLSTVLCLCWYTSVIVIYVHAHSIALAMVQDRSQLCAHTSHDTCSPSTVIISHDGSGACLNRARRSKRARLTWEATLTTKTSDGESSGGSEEGHGGDDLRTDR